MKVKLKPVFKGWFQLVGKTQNICKTKRPTQNQTADKW